MKCTFDLIFEVNAYTTTNLTPNNQCLAQTVTELKHLILDNFSGSQGVEATDHPYRNILWLFFIGDRHKQLMIG